MTSQVSANCVIVVSSICAMVIEDDQPLSRFFCPPADQFQQSTIVEACCNQHLHPSIHEQLSISLFIRATARRATPLERFPFHRRSLAGSSLKELTPHLPQRPAQETPRRRPHSERVTQ